MLTTDTNITETTYFSKF